MAKKTKKIETPIDQRETFVSIQKNFADSDLSVEEKLKTLYDLQQADSAIDRILQLRGELPMEVEALENDILDIDAKITHVSENIEESYKSIEQNKHNIVECKSQIEKYTEQINNVSNSREYASLNKEIENQDLLMQIGEKNIRETEEHIMDKKQELESLNERLEVKKGDLEAKKEELATIVESTSKEEEKLVAKRNACAAKIDDRTMSAYERIRKSCNNHLAVVSVFNHDSCGGCFSTIAPQRLIDIASNKKLIICEYCGRILVSPDFE